METPDSQTVIATGPEQPGPVASGVLDYIAVIAKWRKFITVFVSVSVVCAVIVSLLLPKWYRASVSLLPPKDTGTLNPLGSASSILKTLGSGGMKMGGLGSSQGAYNYLAVLNSRTAREQVVRRFNLMAVYEVKDSSMESAIEELDGNVKTEIQADDYLTVDVLDKDRQRSADMANYFVEVLNTISIRLATEEARNNREFIERRVIQARQDLRNSEDSLRSYQERTGTMFTPEQASTLESVGLLYATKVKKEMELAILSRTVGIDHPSAREARVELEEVDKKIAHVPQTGMTSLRLYRDMIIQQKVMELLVPMYEQSRIEEQRNIPVILVLDKAVPPEKRARPKRMIIVAAAGATSLLFAIMLAFFRERVMQLSNADPRRDGLFARIWLQRAHRGSDR